MAEVDTSAGKLNPVGQSVDSLAITSSTTGTVSPAIKGELISIRVDAPNLSTDSDFILSIEDGDSKEIFTKGSISDNATTVVYFKKETGYLDRIPLVGTESIKVTYTTSQTSAWKIVTRFKDR